MTDDTSVSELKRLAEIALRQEHPSDWDRLHAALTPERVVALCEAAEARVIESTDENVERVAVAICKSRTCRGFKCCQWPANIGERHKCPVARGNYGDAARAAINALEAAFAQEKPGKQEPGGFLDSANEMTS